MIDEGDGDERDAQREEGDDAVALRQRVEVDNKEFCHREQREPQPEQANHLVPLHKPEHNPGEGGQHIDDAERDVGERDIVVDNQVLRQRKDRVGRYNNGEPLHGEVPFHDQRFCKIHQRGNGHQADGDKDERTDNLCALGRDDFLVTVPGVPVGFINKD